MRLRTRPMLLSLLSQSRHPRDLHPFPTRRSSDLTWPPWPPAAHSRTRASAGIGSTSPSAALTRRATPTPRRSEEHTSELQSRRDLVCRLLLEKKNRIAQEVLVDMLHRHADLAVWG